MSLIEVIRSEGERLAQIAAGRLEIPIPQYPTWAMEGLVVHTGAALGRTAIFCRLLPRERISSPRPDPDDDVLAWYRTQLDDCLTELAAADLSTPVWGFGPRPTLDFWMRRMVTETGTHRWDADQAVGEVRPLIDEVAEVGLDEVATLWMLWTGDLPGLTVRATDLGRSWDYAGGGEIVEGTASDLYLRFMSRPSPVRLPEAWARAFDSLPPPPR